MIYFFEISTFHNTTPSHKTGLSAKKPWLTLSIPQLPSLDMIVNKEILLRCYNNIWKKHKQNIIALCLYRNRIFLTESISSNIITRRLLKINTKERKHDTPTQKKLCTNESPRKLFNMFLKENLLCCQSLFFCFHLKNIFLLGTITHWPCEIINYNVPWFLYYGRSNL